MHYLQYYVLLTNLGLFKHFHDTYTHLSGLENDFFPFHIILRKSKFKVDSSSAVAVARLAIDTLILLSPNKLQLSQALHSPCLRCY